MNVNNYGFPLYFSTGYNMSAATNLTITFTRPDKTTFTRDFSSPSPVYVGQVDVVVQMPQSPCGPNPGSNLFAAFEYAGYLIQAGDINQAGQWSARVTYDNSVLPEHLTSDTAYFTVDP